MDINTDEKYSCAKTFCDLDSQVSFSDTDNFYPSDLETNKEILSGLRKQNLDVVSRESQSYQFSHFDAQYFDDNDTFSLNKSIEDYASRKFLILPSMFAGLFLGINNFLLGLISDIGLPAAFIFSLGALIFTFTIRLSQMM